MLTPEDAATLKAHLDGVDHAAREAERAWGVDRLPMLVDADLRARFYRQQASWSAAMEEAWSAPSLSRDLLAAVASKSAAMIRGWAALQAAASEAGHRPISAEVWEVRLADGKVGAIVQTNAEASKAIADGRHVAVYTVDEIANIIAALPPAICAAKIEFPGAKVQPQRDRAWLRDGDPIPF